MRAKLRHGKCGATAWAWLSSSFEDTFASRVKRRVNSRIVGFWRATELVETCSGAGLPVTLFAPGPIQAAGP